MRRTGASASLCSQQLEVSEAITQVMALVPMNKRTCAVVDREQSKARAPHIAVKFQGRIVLLRLDSIDWVQSKRNYLCLHVGAVEHWVRDSVHSFERKLRPYPFVRIHRSNIVNINRIREVKRWYTGEYIVRLDTGKELTLSKTYRDHFFALAWDRAS